MVLSPCIDYPKRSEEFQEVRNKSARNIKKILKFKHEGKDIIPK